MIDERCCVREAILRHPMGPRSRQCLPRVRRLSGDTELVFWEGLAYQIPILVPFDGAIIAGPLMGRQEWSIPKPTGLGDISYIV